MSTSDSIRGILLSTLKSFIDFLFVNNHLISQFVVGALRKAVGASQRCNCDLEQNVNVNLDLEMVVEGFYSFL